MPDACHLSPVGLESRGGLASLGRCGMLDVVSPLMKGQDMPYITLNSAEPGIRGLLRYRPETGRPLSELAEVLLRRPGTLTPGERELIAAYVSALNECRYCSASHAACAAAQLPGGMAVVEQVRSDASSAPVRAQLKSLLAIAAAVQQGGLHVTAELVAQARAAGATDLEIHDTVLIAAVFCMFNRYVDGLATIAPEDPALYAAGAQRLITDGYLPPVNPRRHDESQRPAPLRGPVRSAGAPALSDRSGPLAEAIGSPVSGKVVCSRPVPLVRQPPFGL